MDSIDYEKLYQLQDEVLEVVFGVENEFYLTGGTCLSRFYKEKRYSDDLDFFTNNSARYRFAIRNIKQALLEKFDLKIEIESKDFTRFYINNILQVDFVNDIDYRFKEPILTSKNYLIDNIENILSNKLTAVIGRDNPKDIFDIYLIWKFYQFSWQEILQSAHKKAGFENEELLVRLKSFPKNLLDEIKIIDKEFLKDFNSEFLEIILEIEQQFI
ncbi:nucleotidyl transferase AbiEii/AbiGii toxin family protein [Aliarcobacter cryaerophilus]|uniref:nucleotidyl transferase AbiEii/AbiGii toxin family protein n=1 Tax=Aliarcobacter cryaerophilus TaxID=28198 RepID=UPI003DA462A3